MAGTFDDGFVLQAASGADLRVRRQDAEETARGIVLVHHGLAEHSARYSAFAAHLAGRGFHVFAHDHRGHGSTRAPDAPPRRFAERDGADKVIADCRAVHAHACSELPGLPVLVFGHSMGGLIALNYARRFGFELAGLAVWNANFDKGVQEQTARIGLKAERALKGSDVASALLARGTFESWGKSIENRRTMADWLSHEANQVDAYIADPLCGWTPTVSMYEDVLAFVFEGGTLEGLRDLPVRLPIHLLGGSADPATARGAAITRLGARMREAGLHDLTALVIEGARHETLNEIEAYRAPALASLDAWLERIVGTGAE